MSNVFATALSTMGYVIHTSTDLLIVRVTCILLCDHEYYVDHANMMMEDLLHPKRCDKSVMMRQRRGRQLSFITFLNTGDWHKS